MALFKFICSICKKEGVSLGKKPEPPSCCEQLMTRNSNGPSSRSTEVLDNGFMAKRVERLQDIERICREKSQQELRKIKGEDDSEKTV